MSQANCFIILGSDTGNVAAAELVEVQLLEGLV
jgi:molybdopterin biosynthesis enzyme